MPHCLFNIKADVKLIKVFDSLLRVIIALRKGTYKVIHFTSRFDLPDVNSKERRKKKSNKEEDLKSLLKLQEELQENLKLSDLLQFSKSKFKIVKMHDTTHHIFTIMLFEDPQSYSTEVGELLNKILIKEVYSRGNHHESFDFVGFFQFFQSHFPSFESDTHSDIQKRRRTYLCRISQEFEKRSTRTMENV